jgi:hypothetical protein
MESSNANGRAELFCEAYREMLCKRRQTNIEATMKRLAKSVAKAKALEEKSTKSTLNAAGYMSKITQGRAEFYLELQTIKSTLLLQHFFLPIIFDMHSHLLQLSSTRSMAKSLAAGAAISRRALPSTKNLWELGTLFTR